MGAIAITMFLGIGTQAQLFDVRVSEATIDEFGTVLSQIGRAVFGTGAGFIVLQGATMAILVLAANTAYQDFPRLSAILAAPSPHASAVPQPGRSPGLLQRDHPVWPCWLAC